MIADTPIPVIAAFLPTLLDHDRLAAAGTLADIPTVLVVGDADLMTPLAHSRTLADVLPAADLVVEEGAGHAIMLERPDPVNAAIRAVCTRATAALGMPRPRPRPWTPPRPASPAESGGGSRAGAARPSPDRADGPGDAKAGPPAAPDGPGGVEEADRSGAPEPSAPSDSSDSADPPRPDRPGPRGRTESRSAAAGLGERGEPTMEGA
jgi:hypothetical protein